MPRLKPFSTYYILILTQALSMIGSRMTSIAVGIWVFNETGLTAPLLLAAFFNELPGMLAGSLAGVLVDRWDRQWVMMLSDAGQAIGSLLLMASFLSGAFQIWHLYAVAFIQGSFSAFQGPAYAAAATLLVPEGSRDRANAVQQISFPLAGVIAPILAGSLYPWVGVSGVIAVDLATFLVAVGVVSRLKIPKPLASSEGDAARGDFLRELRGGLAFVLSRRTLLAFVLYLALINFLLNGPLELAIPYLIAITGSEALMGMIMGAMSLGAFTGAALIAARRRTRSRLRNLLAGLFFSGCMFLLYGTARSSLLLATSLYLLMIPLPIMGALSTSILQAKTPADMQGRIFAAIGQLNFVASTSSFLFTGSLVDRFLEPAARTSAWASMAPLVGQGPGAGMGLLLVVTGIIILVATLAVWSWPEFRNLERMLPNCSDQLIS